jgi:hypothetical protein
MVAALAARREAAHVPAAAPVSAAPAGVPVRTPSRGSAYHARAAAGHFGREARSPGPTRQRQGVQGTSKRSTSFRIVFRPAAFACGQKLAVVPWYSIWNTAFAASVKGASASHSANC